MSANQPDNPEPKPPALANRGGVTPPPVARSTRRTPEQVVAAAASADAFATPSEAPAQPEPQAFSGFEPPIFGGVNPPAAVPGTLPAAPADVAPGQLDEDDEISAGPIVPPNPRNVLRFIRRSSATLAVLLAVSLTFGTWAVVESIPAESYVQVTIHMRSPAAPTPDEAAPQQVEISNILRAYPLRAAARTLLAKDAPNLAPGFLDGMLFTGASAITWEDPTTLTLRVNTIRPAEDRMRLGAVASAFFQASEIRSHALQERSAKLENYRVHVRELRRQQEEYQRDQAQVPGTNPATADTGFARALEQRIKSTLAEISREERIVKTWISPDRIDDAGVQSHDNRPFRRNALLLLWAILLTIFGAPISLNYLQKRRDTRIRQQKNRAVLTRQVKTK